MDDDSGDSRGKSDVEGGDSDFSDDFDDTRLIHTDPSEGIAVRTRSSQTANEIKVPMHPPTATRLLPWAVAKDLISCRSRFRPLPVL